jgi:hypothetical protein
MIDLVCDFANGLCATHRRTGLKQLDDIVACAFISFHTSVHRQDDREGGNNKNLAHVQTEGHV